MLTPWKESYDQPRQHIRKQRHYFANKGLSSQGYGFSSSHVWMWELDCKENWVPKNWCFWTVVLEKTLESPLDCKEIQPVHPKGDQSWVFVERNDAKAETPILWPPHVKSCLIGKDSDAGRDWGQEEKGTTEDEMAGWYHQFLELVKLMSIESVMPSSHLILCCPFSSCLQSFPASGSFPKSQLFAWGGQNTGVSASASVLPMNTQDNSPLGWTGWISLQSKGLSRVFVNTTVQKHKSFSTQLSL